MYLAEMLCLVQLIPSFSNYSRVNEIFTRLKYVTPLGPQGLFAWPSCSNEGLLVVLGSFGDMVLLTQAGGVNSAKFLLSNPILSRFCVAGD